MSVFIKQWSVESVAENKNIGNDNFDSEVFLSENNGQTIYLGTESVPGVRTTLADFEW